MIRRATDGRIIVRFPRPVVIAFGWTVFLGGIAATFAIGYMIVWAIFAAWPDR
jgi:hypothetical protein